MGIVNNTPDSFYDGGRHYGADAAAAHGRTLLAEGADVLDVGGQTRPDGRRDRGRRARSSASCR